MTILRKLIVGVMLCYVAVTAASACFSGDFDQPRADDGGWRYTEQSPPPDWIKIEFDDRAWTEARGGFGTVGTPGARVGTVWNSPDIWLRKSVELDTVPEKLALLVHHDEDAEIFVNGIKVKQLKGYSTGYQIMELDDAAGKAVKAGQNLLAVHCHQTVGGQYIDVHLIDATRPPLLLPVQRAERPFLSELITPWGESLDRDNPWAEYPRPAFQRSNWRNLNGPWEYQITPETQNTPPQEWAGSILVPFSLESRLSGVQRLLKPDQALWYRRTFTGDDSGKRVLLNFEAVDYECEVFVNGHGVGQHRGGHTPFSFDISQAIQAGENELMVRVIDRTEMMQLRGKQVLDPHAIWYTQVSGIWQTVWLESVAETYLQDALVQTDAANGSVRVTPNLVGSATDRVHVHVTIKDGDVVVASSVGRGNEVQVLTVPAAKLWSPASPHLYDLQWVVSDGDEVLDRVDGYVGIRNVGKIRDENGHWRMSLNGEVLFHWGPLDQGWWPDGLLTPPSDEAMRFDVDFLKQAGFNMIRKHIKVEPRRFYEYCDRVGMLVWQDQVSGGPGPPWTRLARNPQDAVWSDADHQQYMRELERMVGTLENHPCVVVWVPFNEAWGQHRTMDVGRWMVARDPSRLVNVASGGNFWPVGDIVDHHEYPHPAFPFAPRRDREFIMVVGEFGGHGLPIRGHLWNPEMDNWGYGGLPKNSEEYRERYEESLRRLAELRDQGIAAGVYTQTTDVEGEINGLMTYDRKVIKLPAAELLKLHVEAGIVREPK